MDSLRAVFAPRLTSPLVFLTTLLVLLSCGDGGGTGPGGDPPPVMPVARVVVTPDTVRLAAGGSVTAVVRLEASGGAPLTGRAITWSVANDTVATVSSAGLITAVGDPSGPVSTVVTATSEGVSGTAVVIVSPRVANILYTNNQVILYPGETGGLTVSVRDADSVGVARRSVTWTNSDPSVATLVLSGGSPVTLTDGNGQSVAGATAVAPGHSTVTVTAEGLSGTIDVWVVPEAVDSVEIRPDTVLVLTGFPRRATAVVTDAAGRSLTDRSVQWSIGDPSLATVDSTGMITGLVPGFTTVSATSEGKTDSAVLEVRGGNVAGVVVTPGASTLSPGQSVQLSTTVTDALGNVLTDRSTFWTVNDSTVATVSSAGLVQAVAVGTATVTANAGGITGTAAITVSVVTVGSVTVAPGAATLMPGQTVQLAATVRDSDGNVLTDRTVAWSSSDATVATVSGSGLATAVADGTATITAAAEGQSGAANLTVSTPPPASDSLLIVSGGGQTGLSSVPLPDSMVVFAKAADGSALVGATVTWSVSGGAVSTDGMGAGEGADGAQSASLAMTTTQTDANGRAMALLTPGSGGATVTATLSGAPSVSFQATGVTATAGTTWMGRNSYVEYIPGTLPLILSAPHGGTLEPGEIPDRTYGTTVRDFQTDDLARRMANEIQARTGQRPHLIISHLRRTKLDPNREIVEAAQGSPPAEHAWNEFQGFVGHARSIVEGQGGGFYMDVHGHGHAIQRLELGYLLDGGDLAQSDAAVDGMAGSSSLATLAGRAGVPFSQLLRGPKSLGAGFVNGGFPSVPSPGTPDPGGASYFTGGYNTRAWGSRNGGSVDSVQLEANMDGVRDSDANRAAFASAAAAVLEQFLRDWYGWG